MRPTRRSPAWPPGSAWSARATRRCPWPWRAPAHKIEAISKAQADGVLPTEFPAAVLLGLLLSLARDLDVGQPRTTPPPSRLSTPDERADYVARPSDVCFLRAAGRCPSARR